jgi:hypothetical protein
MTITKYWIEPGQGCCTRSTIIGLDVTDGKAKGVRISEHNSRAVAEKKLEKLNRALDATVAPAA